MYSMTGYGKGEYVQGGITLVVEIKTVNNKNFDLNAKMPRSFIAFDDLVRKEVQKYVKRGRIDLFVNFSDTREKEISLEVNLEKATAYYNASKEISEKLGLPNDCTVSMIMKSPEVIVDNTLNDFSEFEEILRDTVSLACKNLNEMRKIEGEKLVNDMLSRLDTISSVREKICERAPKVALEYKEKLKNRITEALADVKMDETRLLNEVAFFTDKVNIDEELTRLNSHIMQFKQIVSLEGAGKKLDFLMQEFNRETNTICSKSNHKKLSQYR